jgi:hypothetical protein
MTGGTVADRGQHRTHVDHRLIERRTVRRRDRRDRGSPGKSNEPRRCNDRNAD